MLAVGGIGRPCRRRHQLLCGSPEEEENCRNHLLEGLPGADPVVSGLELLVFLSEGELLLLEWTELWRQQTMVDLDSGSGPPARRKTSSSWNGLTRRWESVAVGRRLLRRVAVGVAAVGAAAAAVKGQRVPDVAR